MGKSPNDAQKLYAATPPRPAASPNPKSNSDKIGQTAPIQQPSTPIPAFQPAVQREADRAAASYDDTERTSVGRYQSKGPRKNAGYADVNNYLRFSTPPVRGIEWLNSVVSGLDAAIAKGSLPEPVTTFRAIRGTDKLIDDWKDALETGLPWIELGYFSTATSDTVSPEFWGASKRKILFEVVFKKGTKGPSHQQVRENLTINLS